MRMMALGEKCWNNGGGYPLGGFTNWDRIYKKLNIFRTTSTSSGLQKWTVHFCTPDVALVVRNMSSFFIYSISVCETT
jgi:hypothetical protein